MHDSDVVREAEVGVVLLEHAGNVSVGVDVVGVEVPYSESQNNNAHESHISVKCSCTTTSCNEAVR